MAQVSIIMPNYNKGEFIEAAIESLRAQTMSDWELIFVDDQSTDISLEVVRRLADADRRIRIEVNPGVRNGSACRNLGLNLATGEYLVFMDSDDCLSKTCLQRRLCRIEEGKLDAAIFSMGTFRSEVSDLSSVWRPVKIGALERFLSHRMPWAILSPIWRREWVLQQGGFNPRYPRLQDVEFHTRCLLNPAFKFEVFPDMVDCYYRLPVPEAGTSVVKLKPTVEGFSLYLEEFTQKAGDRSGLLFLSLFGAIERICRAYRERAIARKLMAEQCELLLKGSLSESCRWRILVIRIYLFLFGYMRLPARGTNGVIRLLLSLSIRN